LIEKIVAEDTFRASLEIGRESDIGGIDYVFAVKNRIGFDDTGAVIDVL